MKKLELEPSTYEKEFTELTGGINIEIQNWILDRVGQSKEILEVGCGPGTLAIKMAKNNNVVTAIDSNPNMIQAAETTAKFNPDLKIIFQEGSAVAPSDETYDIIISTFMLSELRPLEQQIFLRNMWKSLKKDGKLLLAAEFEPSGFSKLQFMIKRWWYKRKMGRMRLNTHPLKHFCNYLNPIGFEISTEKLWAHGSIRVIEITKRKSLENSEPGFYSPPTRQFKGIKGFIGILRCLLTGQVDHVPIEPGIYKSGNPNSKSPIIVTANYLFTYIRLMKDIQEIDAWVLCVDSRGINVWCAARGPDFGNKQIIEAVKASGIGKKTDSKTLYLPQLAAGGVAVPKLPKNTEDFPFRSVKYGPVWSKHLPQYLKDKPAKKPDFMKLAKFTLYHRMRGFITHSTFLLRKIFFWPSMGLLLFLLIAGVFIQDFTRLIFVGEIWLAVLVANLLITTLFPLTNFTRRFVVKGIIFGILNVVVFGFILWLINQSIPFVLWNSVFLFWLAFFSTMSFSGYTFSTSITEISNEYPVFKQLNKYLLYLGLILSVVGAILL
jgi:ubiquinone/menaquinone biosynthesis C-methylase UbiE